MDNLLHYYNTRLGGLVGFIVIWLVFVPNDLEPFLTSKLGASPWVARIDGVLTSKFFIVLMFVAGQYIIRRWLWKLERPRFNFEGEWEGKTTYARVWLSEAASYHSFDSPHNVNIEQDCLSFKLSPTTGSEYVNWGSYAANLVDEATIRYAYFVRYSNLTRFPGEVKGYEEMNVMRRGFRGRPQVLTGIFYHCVQDPGPVYSGRVIFKRKASRLQRILSWLWSILVWLYRKLRSLFTWLYGALRLQIRRARQRWSPSPSKQPRHERRPPAS